jgi:hypothetical protein
MHISGTYLKKPKASIEVVKSLLDSQSGHHFEVLSYSKAPNGAGEGFGYHMAAALNGQAPRVFYSWMARIGSRWVLSVSDELQSNWPITGSAKVLRLTEPGTPSADCAEWRASSARFIEGRAGCKQVIVGRSLIFRRPIYAGLKSEVRIDAVSPCGDGVYKVLAGSDFIGSSLFISEVEFYSAHPIDTVEIELQESGIEPDSRYAKIGCAYVLREAEKNIVAGREFTPAERAQAIAQSLSQFSFYSLCEERPFFM